MKGVPPDMNRKMTYMMTAALMIAALLQPGIAFAQGTDHVDPEKARAEIERTDEVIASAREIVQDTRSQKARTALEYSMKLQTQAKNSAGISNNAMAYKLTLQSRNEAWHAINLARTDARQEELTKRLVEHTTEKLVMLRSRIAETGMRDERVMRLMNESRSLLEKSKMNHMQLRGELALKLAENSARLADQAEKRFRRSLNLMEMCQRRLTLLERLSERAYAHVEGSGDERAALQLQRAEEQLLRAREALSGGRYEACRMNLEKAERMLRTMMRNTERNRAGDPENMMAEARMLQERAEEMIGAQDGPSEKAYRLLEQARRMLDRAESDLGGGNAEEALRLMEEARRMLRSAVEEAGADVSPQRAADEIDRAAEAGEMVRATLEQCDAEGTRNLYERANQHMVRAKENLDNGQRERAVAEARIARNLFNRIREICAQ
jgi:HEPN domain-containing protein